MEGKMKWKNLGDVLEIFIIEFSNIDIPLKNFYMLYNFIEKSENEHQKNVQRKDIVN